MKQTEIWREAKRLFDLGFAIHWLHPKSKRPVEIGWTTGPRKDWKELLGSYRPGYNVGVRLGAPSVLNHGVLAVIDVDIKSKDARHRKEALEAVKTLIGEASLPEVHSGRGGGSRHYYCVTRSPFKTFNPFSSLEKVKVHMPSKSVSKREREELTSEEIAAGTRISKAWEISLYSDGRQVVLPPSIHPDTGERYVWANNFVGAQDIPLLDFERFHGASSDSEKGNGPTGGARERRGGNVEDGGEFKVTIDETLDVRWLPDISENIRALIVDGQWKGSVVNDRSAYLLVAASGLVSAGVGRDEVLTILTDRATYLGECAFEHAQTESRERAAKWLWNYTVKRVLRDKDPTLAFKDTPMVESRALTDEEVRVQSLEFEEGIDWRSNLQRAEKSGQLRNSFHNCQTILVHTATDKAPLGHNEFLVNDFFLNDTEWGGKKGAPIVDSELLNFKKYCVDVFNVEFSITMVDEVFRALAVKRKFNPVKDYLKALKWDGVSRLETWLEDFAGAIGPEAYVRAVSKKVLVAMVKRVFEPGCKFDHVLILEGIQGSGKSTLLNNLAAPWFSDEALNIGDKDAVLTMQGKWLIELGELSALSRAEIETMKAFITRRTDHIRAPYGRRVEEYPRQCIFIGSTNLEEYLKDETGNRRFWPIKCGAINFKGLAEMRDQLFAEAVAYYGLGEPVYLDGVESEELARIEQIRRGELDEWQSSVQELVRILDLNLEGFEMREISKNMTIFGAEKLSMGDQKRIGKCLRNIGFEKFQETTGDRRKLWRKTIRETNPSRGVREPVEGFVNSSIVADFY